MGPIDEAKKLEQAAKAAADLVNQAANDARLLINQAAVTAVSSLTTSTAVQAKEIEFIRAELKSINSKLDSLNGMFVTQDQFTPVRNIVYGLVALIMTSFLGAVIALVIRH